MRSPAASPVETAEMMLPRLLERLARLAGGGIHHDEEIARPGGRGLNGGADLPGEERVAVAWLIRERGELAELGDRELLDEARSVGARTSPGFLGGLAPGRKSPKRVVPTAARAAAAPSTTGSTRRRLRIGHCPGAPTGGRGAGPAVVKDLPKLRSPRRSKRHSREQSQPPGGRWEECTRFAYFSPRLTLPWRVAGQTRSRWSTFQGL